MIVNLGPVSESARLWAARRTIAQHREPPSEERTTGSCRQCQPAGGCPMLAWAVEEIRQAPGWFVEREDRAPRSTCAP
jgi:hypothetical protein